MFYLFLFLLFCLLPPSSPYCANPGSNPGFTGPPRVEQVSLTSVRVSWRGLVTRIDCADQFIVKSWRRNDPNDYKLSDLLTTDIFSYDVEDLTPNRDYVFQAVAREDKGWLGRDWNKSPTITFSTSRRNPTVPPQARPTEAQPPPAVVPGGQAQSNQPVNVGQSGGQSGQAQPRNPNKKSPSEEEDAGLSFVVIIGIVVGSCLLLLVGVASIYNIAKMSRGRKREEEDDLSDSESLHLENRVVSRDSSRTRSDKMERW